MPKVSIVLPTYNGQMYIKDSVESIINQTYTDWELIIVNDCSSDNTREIINKFELNDPRIHVVENDTNQKLPKSLNIGFRKAMGEYLTWTSDDNIYHSNAIEKMTSYLDNNNSVMVCAGMEWIDEEGTFIKRHMKYSHDFMMINDCVGACFMYKREVLDTVGEYDTSLFLVEDYEYWLRILFRYKNISYIDESLYTYRFHRNSLTATRKMDIHNMLLKMRKMHLDKLINNWKDNKAGLCEIYLDFLRNKCLDECVKEKIEQLVPELTIIKHESAGDRIIIYGAGKIGERAYGKYGNHISFFSDKNVEKIGKRINGIMTISIDEMINRKNEYSIVIAASIRNAYDLIVALYEAGVDYCDIYNG